MALGDEDLLTIPFRLIVFLIGGLPFLALILCIGWSLLFHYESSTWTHCNVSNWLPSLSASIASNTPERYIWQLFIGIHGAPRFALAFAFKNFLLSSPLRPFTLAVSWFSRFCYLACALNIAEIFFLLLLSTISSVEDYALHRLSFLGFLTCGLAYMFISTWLFDYSGRRRTTSLGEYSFQYKVLCITGKSISILLALYFFYRHNRYCEPGIYTLFALCEYSLVFFNILFHSTMYYDFHAKSFTLISASSTYQYDALPLHNYSEKRGT